MVYRCMSLNELVVYIIWRWSYDIVHDQGPLDCGHGWYLSIKVMRLRDQTVGRFEFALGSEKIFPAFPQDVRMRMAVDPFVQEESLYFLNSSQT